MLKKIMSIIRLFFSLDLSATTYVPFDERDIITRKTRGCTRIQKGNYITQEEFEVFKNKVLNFKYN